VSASERLHEAYVADRRARVLIERLTRLLPDRASVLDVGCGDGRLTEGLMKARPDLDCRGLEVLVREECPIPVEAFDGRNLPVPDDSFDVVLFVDVLHHSDHAEHLIGEAKRVARNWVVLKDHTLTGPFAETTLRFMDRVGNLRHGVALPYDYWTESRWRDVLEDVGLHIDTWISSLGLYPFPASLLFDRRLHFLAKLGVE
jgi:SAM-dependent methyltransferase